MELIEKQTAMLFPTPLFTGKISDVTACDRIEQKLRELQHAEQGLRHKFDKRNFLSSDDIHLLPEMKELVDLVLKEAGFVLDLYRVKRDSHYITNMWANITAPNRWHQMHFHPNCLLSGILYVRAPENCGNTTFQDPRIHSRMIEPAYWENNVLNSTEFSVPPQKGRMVMWPSFLSHTVDYGTAPEDEDRIVIAFNIMVRGVIDRRTARLELR
jgi:uncharacterized protein (TIGR02466 family)